MAPEVLHICVLGMIFGFSLNFYRFTNRVILPFEITEVFFKEFIPQFLEFDLIFLFVRLYILLLSGA